MGGVLKDFGKRLREERGRLGKTVDEFADMSGIHTNSLGNYERGERAANAALLLIWQDLKIDVGYVLTGVRTNFDIGPDEQRLLDNFSRLDINEQEIVTALIARLVGDPIVLGGAVYQSQSQHSSSPDDPEQPKDD